MIEAGIPCGSAGALAGLMKKVRGKPKREAIGFLSMVHPFLMENLAISNGRLVVKDKRYLWQRHGGWDLA